MLSYVVVCLILGLAVFVELRLVTDIQTDGRTDDNNIYHASITSRGKMFYLNMHRQTT